MYLNILSHFFCCLPLRLTVGSDGSSRKEGARKGKFLLPWGEIAPSEWRREKGAMHQGFTDQMETDVVLSTECFFAHPGSDKKRNFIGTRLCRDPVKFLLNKLFLSPLMNN